MIFVWSRQLGRRDYSIGIWVMSELRVEFEMEDGSENQAEGRLVGEFEQFIEGGPTGIELQKPM